MTELNILYGQDIFDLANKIGYTIDNVYKLITENPFITSIDYDLNANPGQVLEYDSNFKVNNPQVLYQLAKAASDPNRSVVAKENQTLFDIALMSTGIESIMKLVNENNISNINNTDLEGKMFNFSINNVKDRGFYNRKLDITTGEITKDVVYYLLQEDGFYILQEDTSKIIV